MSSFRKPTVLSLRPWVFLCTLTVLASCSEPKPPSPAFGFVNPETMSTFHGDYIGMNKFEAIEQAKIDDYIWRVIEQDGRSLPVSMDHNPDRINFVIENGVVTKVTEG